MSYDFYASIEDKVQILRFIFEHTDLRMSDSYSSYSEEICEYKCVEDITDKFDLANGGEYAVLFQLYSPKFKGKILFERVELNPKYCNGHTFRYATRGWGLIQFYLGGVKNDEQHLSHIGHSNEKGALQHESTYPELGKVSEWNWEAINRVSRALKYEIHNRLAVKKIGSIGVLGGAESLCNQGIVIRN